MKNQTDINEKMRAILVDWLIDVHIKFKLLPETLFLTVNITDRFIERNVIARQKLQLVGVAAMLIACKYEEIYPPEIKDFVYVTDKAYSKEDVLDMEGKILSCLHFQLTVTSSLRFLERYSKLINMDQKYYNLCRYMLELCLVEYKMLRHTPSLLASAAIYISNRIAKKDGWNDCLTRNAKLEENVVKVCAKEVLGILQAQETSQLQAIKRKFSSSKFNEVSKMTSEFSNLSI
jgi:cyclin B